MNGADLGLDEATLQILQSRGFDESAFTILRNRVRRGETAEAFNTVRGAVSPLSESEFVRLPARGTQAFSELASLGERAIQRGEVGAVVLAGGMATRFGGVVKAIVEALDGKTFLELKVGDIQAVSARLRAPIPTFLMTSYATESRVREAAAQLHRVQAPVETFEQFLAPRLTPAGDLFIGGDGKPSLYAPGHGDLPFAIERAGILDRFASSGGKYLYMSNVDNLAATLEPAVVGAHITYGALVSGEVVDKEKGDKGGGPARVDGTPQIVESFRFPSDFDQDLIPVFNTNSFMLSVEALRAKPALDWLMVHKNVDDRPAVQFERLIGQLTAFVSTAFFRVERHGPDGRFQPAKDPEELDKRRPRIREVLRARGVL